MHVTLNELTFNVYFFTSLQIRKVQIDLCQTHLYLEENGFVVCYKVDTMNNAMGQDSRKVNSMDSRARTCLHILGLPLTSCMTLGKLLDLPVPQFPYL